MKLLEIFSSKVKHAITKQSNDLLKAQAQINGRDIVVAFTRDRDNEWTLEFIEIRRDQEGGMHLTSKKSGSGKEFEVFSFVKDMLIYFVELYHPDSIEFTASKKDENRAKLYARMLSKISTVLKGYKGVTQPSEKQSDAHRPNNAEAQFFYIIKESLLLEEHENLIKRAQAGILAWRGVKRPGEKPSDPGDLGKGTYYSTLKAKAKCYGHTLIRGELKFKNPLVLTDKEAYDLAGKYKTIKGTEESRHAGALKMTADLKAQGHDGLIAISKFRGTTELEIVDYRNVKTGEA